ncbi:sigma-54-dependent Fis family transcriptional regulator [Desulfotalea psychrophila]|uniref:Sigma-54-dependent Fis family transcriptional regulator n=1 Tax=Desulfotalea psychrophila TaxID=84980 RepID=A0ABS3ATB0_9BACT|nr:sigma-54-dependent Fis family transcriptional regulator [Desulfotalea psychrophila]
MNKNDPSPTRILLVDDEPDLLSGLKRSFAKRLPDVNVLTAASGNEALDILSVQDVALVLMDIMMGDMDGLEALDRIRSNAPDQTVILMTGYGTIELAVDAIRRGAWDFVTKPLELDNLTRILQKGLERSRLIEENKELRSKISSAGSVPEFIGQSPTMQRLYETIKTSATSEYTVLIRGASGTGKELCARAIHRLSPRSAKPFIMVNCPAIPENLLESELFGYSKGAFTGADKDHAGLFSLANGGTLCLDEIGDIPVNLQTKLLRVLQEQEIKPLGADTSTKIDVRIIASTNADLEKKITEGKFREDLYYRLEVLTLHMPPLIEITEDIPLLANFFLKKAGAEPNVSEKSFSETALTPLFQHNWPGNIRELQNVIRRAVLFCPGSVIDQKHLKLGTPPPALGTTINQDADKEMIPYKEAKESCLDSFTRQYVHRLLKQCNGNISQAARLSDLTRAALQKIIRRYDIDGNQFR